MAKLLWQCLLVLTIWSFIESEAFHIPTRSMSLRKFPSALYSKAHKILGKDVDAIAKGKMRPPLEFEWNDISKQLINNFKFTEAQVTSVHSLTKDELASGYEMMNLCRSFENACNQAYMQGHIRGFMHLDNGQETIPAMCSLALTRDDIKYSYYREHTHALASGISANKIMAELFAKIDGTCKGAGGSMHIYDVDTHFQGGWALVAEQLPYAVGAARSILLDRQLNPEKFNKQTDNRIAVVFVGDGGAQNGRMAECLNAAAKENLPILFIVIDNGRAINTFTPDVAANSNVYLQGQHYGVPGLLVDGQNMINTVSAGKAVVDYVRHQGPAILQIHTYRFTGHSPADPEHERGRKAEKSWARAEADPIKNFETVATTTSNAQQKFTAEELEAIRKKANDVVKASVDFALKSSPPPRSLGKELEFPESVDMDYNKKAVANNGKYSATAEEVTKKTVDSKALAVAQAHIEHLRKLAVGGTISIGDAVNLAILEEMIRDPTTVIHAEDLQAGSSYNIPKLTQQTFGTLRAADEIIDEGHFIGKALGEGMNGYRPIVELMNTNFGIYGMAEISSAGNTYATTGGQFAMPLTIIGAGGTAPNQALGAEHSQPLHAYVMGIPGLKINTAASPNAAYGITKSMIRDNGPGILFLPVKMMKESKGPVDLDVCLPLNKAVCLHKASDASVKAGKAVTVLTYLHGVKEAQQSIDELRATNPDVEIELIELRALKPLDMDTIEQSLQRTHKLIILDESTLSGGVGATISARVSEQLYYQLDAPIRRLCMDDAPVPYAATMEQAIVKRASDLTAAAQEIVKSTL